MDCQRVNRSRSEDHSSNESRAKIAPFFESTYTSKQKWPVDKAATNEEIKVDGSLIFLLEM